MRWRSRKSSVTRNISAGPPPFPCAQAKFPIWEDYRFTRGGLGNYELNDKNGERNELEIICHGLFWLELLSFLQLATGEFDRKM
jgi:hypothetical protein